MEACEGCYAYSGWGLPFAFTSYILLFGHPHGVGYGEAVETGSNVSCAGELGDSDLLTGGGGRIVAQEGI